MFPFVFIRRFLLPVGDIWLLCQNHSEIQNTKAEVCLWTKVIRMNRWARGANRDITLAVSLSTFNAISTVVCSFLYLQDGMSRPLNTSPRGLATGFHLSLAAAHPFILEWLKKIALITDGGMSAGFITTFHQPCLATFKDMLNVAREAFQISSRKKLKVKEKRKKFYHMLLCYPYQGNLLWVYHTGSRTLTVFLMYQKWKQSRWSQLAASHSYWNITCLLAQAIWKMSRF